MFNVLVVAEEAPMVRLVVGRQNVDVEHRHHEDQQENELQETLRQHLLARRRCVRRHSRKGRINNLVHNLQLIVMRI